MADAAEIPARELATPAVVSETIVVDHGKICVSEHITSVCQRLGISIQPARLRTGRDKGPIERFFRTLREGLLESLPGYKGPDIHSRGLNPEREAFFFLNELDVLSVIPTAHRRRPGLASPQWQPDQVSADRAAALAEEPAPGMPDAVDVEISVEWHDSVAVVDCGPNLERNC
ncbi:hypothetical protein [Streptomyces lunaelactis]|uniref:hypothetical protein n=1 Tax=Streptomyces lunaelactis TaxID=1535768 RepID=UPI002814C3E2|nr:hypothetical protein [Streptomyces lunaelactis]